MASMLAIKLWAVPALKLCTTCLKPISLLAIHRRWLAIMKQRDSTTGYIQHGLVRQFLSYMKIELPRQVKSGGSLLIECSTLQATLSTFCSCYFSNSVSGIVLHFSIWVPNFRELNACLHYFSDSCLQWWHPPWCSEEGAAFTIRVAVTCKQLSVLATLVIVFEKLFYHFIFENSELNACLHYFSDWRCLVNSILQWWYPPWCSDWHWYLFASSV